MKAQLRILVALWMTTALSVAVLGCGDGSGDDAVGGGDGDDSSEPIPLPTDFGDEPDRNRFSADEICQRLPVIQCIAEELCCEDPGRDLRDCLDRQQELCEDQLLAHRVAMQSSAGYDIDLAEEAFNELEQLSRDCDPAITPFETAPDGFGKMLAGTINAGGNCAPDNPNALAMARASLASCREPVTYACLPSDTMWRCEKRGELASPCLTDNNCIEGLYCDNPDAMTADGQCRPRLMDGEACDKDHECASLACWDDVCVARDAQTAFCYAR